MRRGTAFLAAAGVLILCATTIPASAQPGQGAFDAAAPLTLSGAGEIRASEPVFFTLPHEAAIDIVGTGSRVDLTRQYTDVTHVWAYDPVLDEDHYWRQQDNPSGATTETSSFQDARIRILDQREDAAVLVLPLRGAAYSGAYTGEIDAVLGQVPQEWLTEDEYKHEFYTVKAGDNYYGPDHKLTRSHLNLTSPGAYAFEGDFIVFLHGVDYEIVSPDETVRHSTGLVVTQDLGNVRREHRENATLAVRGGSLTVETDAGRTHFYATSVDVTLEGVLRLGDARGYFTEGDRRYKATGAPVTLDGRFTFQVRAPVEGGERRLGVTLTGSLEEAPVALQVVNLAPEERLSMPPAWGLAGGSLALLALGTVVTVGVRRRARLQPRTGAAAEATVETVWETAVLAMGEGDYGQALVALKRVPASAGGVRALIDQGYCLEQLGRLREARAAYEQAVTENPGHAEAHFYYSRVLARLGLTPGALSHLTRAMSLAPHVREMARGDDGFRTLRDDPRFLALVA